MRGAEYSRRVDVPDFKLIGHDYTLPDIVAKVTGQAKYTEYRRADGMLYCRLLRSPMPHARVRSIDASEALKMPGVRAILTAEELPLMPAGGGPGAPPPAPAPGTPPAAVAPAGSPPSGAPAAGAPQAAAGRRGGRRGQGEVAVDEHGQPIQVTPGARAQPPGGGAAQPPREAAAPPPPGAVLPAQPALTNEPMFEGDPILAVAAVDEATAVAAI